MNRIIRTEPLTGEAFGAFGDVLEAIGAPDKMINRGLCGRWHDRARLEVADGRFGISLFKAEPRTLPYTLDMVERHPEGSQAFVPMSRDPFLVIVAPNEDGRPGTPRAFITASGQAVNYHRCTWHGVLSPLNEPGLFAVIDRIGAGNNLEEHWFDHPYRIESGDDAIGN